ncbi:MAG: plasmid partitioning protein RepB [Cohaesibacter sp.]|nr:plasmid partitioning protein RepB [Cohaesibacter sp.]MCV6600294.1 plasmid partitioning protein RepB [Cohaesibacter sp.]
MSKKTSRTQMFGSLVSSLAETVEAEKAEQSGRKTQSSLPARVGSGVVAAAKDSLVTELREERDRLKAQLSGQDGKDAVELDPALIDPSPFPDRLADEDSDSAIEALRRSIEQSGQELPILVRPHPDRPGRYQVAYGHRRLSAIKGLSNHFIRAIIRDLSDTDLLQAQGIENSARQNLSYIERVLFAAHIRALCKNSGEEVARVKMALSITDAEASYLKRIHHNVPARLVRAIGPAPKIGRPRWMKLADLTKEDELANLADHLVQESAFADLSSSDQRFQYVFAGLQKAASAKDSPSQEGSSAPETNIAICHEEQILGHVSYGARLSELRLKEQDFAHYIADQLPQLYLAYQQSKKDEETS